MQYRRVRQLHRCLHKGHWLLWANVLFMVASVLWFIAPFVCWFGDEETCDVIGKTATSLYLVDAVVYLIDWWVKKMSNEESVYGQNELRDTSFMQRVDFYLIGTIFFLLGVIGDFVTGHYGNIGDYYWAHVWYVGSTCFWMVYALFEISRCTMDRLNRDRLQAAARFYLFPCLPSAQQAKQAPGTQHVGVSWDLLGAIFFFVGSFGYFLNAVICDAWPEEVSYDPCFLMQIISAFIFILNSAALFVHHAVLRYLKKGQIFYRDTDLESTKDAERTRDPSRNEEKDVSHDFEAEDRIIRNMQKPNETSQLML